MRRAFGEVDPSDPSQLGCGRYQPGAEELAGHGRILDGPLHPQAGGQVEEEPQAEAEKDFAHCLTRDPGLRDDLARRIKELK